MENASKALLMAGGVIIAILIIGLVTYMFNGSSRLKKASEDTELVQQIAAFNKEYEAYNRKLMRGTDIVSIINKVNSNNEKNEDIPEYQMSIKFKLIESIEYEDTHGNTQIIGSNTYTISSKDDLIWKSIRETDAFTEFKRKIFNCTNTVYNSQTGRIKGMEFVEQNLGN